MPDSTKQINLRIEPEFEALARSTIEHIRRGGPGFRAALEALISDTDSAQYLTVEEADHRFREIERRIARLETD